MCCQLNSIGSHSSCQRGRHYLYISFLQRGTVTPSYLSQVTTDAMGVGNYTVVAIWSAVEPSIGLVCACLPSIHYLLKLLVASTRQLVKPSKRRTVVSSIGKPKRPCRRSPDHSETGSLQRLKVDNYTAVKARSEATGAREALEEFNTSVPLNAIHVQNHIEQTEDKLGR